MQTPVYHVSVLYQIALHAILMGCLMGASIGNPFRLVYYILFNPLFASQKNTIIDSRDLIIMANDIQVSEVNVYVSVHQNNRCVFFLNHIYCYGKRL